MRAQGPTRLSVNTGHVMALNTLEAWEAARQVRDGETSADDLVQAALARIAEREEAVEA